MGTISYYSFDKNVSDGIDRCSIASDDYPITVNCAGNFRTSFPFTTDNQRGRKDFYLLYMVRGEMDILIGDKTHRAVSGNVAIYPPNTHYKYSYSSGEALDYLWVHFTGSYAERLLEECGLSPLPFFGDTEGGRNISHHFKKLFEIYEAKSPLQRHELAAELERTLLSVASSVSISHVKRPLDRSIRYVHTSYNEKISIPELAAMENLSTSRYIALFNEQMGRSPAAYVIDLRMNAATELLQSTDMSIKQVGMLVGYQDSHFFSKLFKKHVGVSPKEYKNALKKKT